jgi:hypothetical protein
MWRGSEGVVAVVVGAQAGEELRLRRGLIGVDEPVPVLDGRLVPYVNLDNAASTPAFCEVTAATERFLPYYASVHRGTGYMSRLSTAAYERARQIVGQFVGADPERDYPSTCEHTTTQVTSTSSLSRRTRCTRRSAPGRWSAPETASLPALTTPGAAPSMR